MVVTDCWQMSQASTFGRHAAYVCHEDVPAVHIQHLRFRQLLQARTIVHIAPVSYNTIGCWQRCTAGLDLPASMKESRASQRALHT